MIFPNILARGLVCAALLLPSVLADPAAAQALAKDLFGAQRQPSRQEPAAIGGYSRGCAAGLIQMPNDGPNWQSMRLSRNRNWGHPAMIEYLMDLSYAATQIGWGRGLYIGDISQPRGGPATSGHASHQIGLDADIWWLAPARLDLSVAERESLSSIPMRSADQRSVTKSWGPKARQLIQIAASDPRVDRIFVAAAIKLEICKTAKSADRAWLQKLRPVAGHDTHFHVRLHCPAGASGCQTQTPSVAELSNGGNGCDDTLNWWVTDFLNPPKRKPGEKPPAPQPPKKGPRQYTMADLPGQCAEVLAAP